MPGEPQYPVNLVLTGRRVLVVGGGRIAARKVERLVDSGADVDVVAPEICEEIRRLGVTCHERRYSTGEVAAYRLVVTATGDPRVDGAVFRDAEDAGVWINSADDPAHCSFTLPAVIRRGELQVTISTGGRSPAVATWLRRRLESELGPELEVLLDLVSEQRRRVQAAGHSTESLDWQRALDSDMLDLIRAGDLGAARERLQACLSSS